MPAPTSSRSTSLTCRRGPRRRAQFGLQALNRALEGISGTTAVHICFGYAAIIHSRPSGYSFLSELAECSCRQISIETAQSKLDCSVLETLPGKKIILGVIDLSSQRGRDAGAGGQRASAARCRTSAAADLIVAPDCGMKYLPREVAFGKLQAMVAGARMVRSQLEREQPAGGGAATTT